MYQQPNNGHGQGFPPNRGGFNQAPNQYGQQFPQQQAFNQPQYGQTGYQAGFQQHGAPHRGGMHSNTFPPLKRQKGNPVITRYAPPPGYQAPPPGKPWQTVGQLRPPAQGAQPPFQQPGQAPSFRRPSGPPSFQNGWQPQQGQFGGGSMFQSPQGYTGPPQNFPPAQQGPQGYPQPFPPQQGFQQQPTTTGPFHQGPQSQANAQQPQQKPWQGSPPQHNNFPIKYENFNGSTQHGTPPRQGSGPRPGSASITSTGSMPPPPLPNLIPPNPNMGIEFTALEDDQATDGANSITNDPNNMNEHEWSLDPDGAIWPKATDVVDNSLSLGLIAWHPGAKMTRAVPSTYVAAEHFSKTAPPAPIELGDSVSTYFMKENHENAYEDIRSSAHWAKIQNDPIFRQFPHEYDAIDIATVKSCRVRQDYPIEVVNEGEEEGEIDVEIPLPTPTNGYGQPALQQASFQSGVPRPNIPQQSGANRSQEDILASLGVEGPPRPVYPTPGPAYGSQGADKPGPSMDVIPQRRVSQGSGSDALAMHGQTGLPPPGHAQAYPPSDDPIEQAIARAIAGNAASQQQSAVTPAEPVRSEMGAEAPESYDPWKPNQGMPVPKEPSPAPSNKTQIGSDFGQDATEGAMANGHNNTPPQTEMDVDGEPHLRRQESSASRKRSYGDFNDREDSDDSRKRQQPNDGSRRPSSSNPVVDDAHTYGHRPHP